MHRKLTALKAFAQIYDSSEMVKNVITKIKLIAKKRIARKKNGKKKHPDSKRFVLKEAFCLFSFYQNKIQYNIKNHEEQKHFDRLIEYCFAP